MQIKVTKTAINKGRSRVPDSCPVAYAINKKLPDEFYCVVTASTVWIHKGDRSKRTIDDELISHHEMPKNAYQFVRTFDELDERAEKKVEPITFELDTDNLLEENIYQFSKNETEAFPAVNPWKE